MTKPVGDPQPVFLKDRMKQGMIISKKFKRVVTAFFIAVLCIAGTFFCRKEIYAKEVSAGDGQGETAIELFVFAPCESCNEEEKFSKEVGRILEDEEISGRECRVYNAYKESGAAHLEETVREYGLSITFNDLPVAIADGKVFEGSYTQIGEALAGYLKDNEKNDGTKLPHGSKALHDTDAEQIKIADSAVYRDICNIGKEDTAVILFVTGSCDSCKRAEEYLKRALKAGKCSLFIYNIMEDDNASVLRKLMKIYEVPDSHQQVPLLFFKTGYLSGAEVIRKNTLESIEGNDASGPWEEVADRLNKDSNDLKISKIKLLVTGFINGLNPCGISMLLMVLSLLLASGRSFYKGSLSYLAGKFLTYLFLGFTIGTFLSVLESKAFNTVQGTVNMILAILSLGFGSFYLADFIHVLKQDYGKERLRLPERLRKWNHSMIRRLTGVQGGILYPTLFVLGIVISAGEFLCTGQVYLATLLYMAEKNGGLNGEIMGDLLIYLGAMCVPMVLLVLLVAKGRSVMSASHLSLKLLPVIKLSYSIFFFVLFFSLLF